MGRFAVHEKKKRRKEARVIGGEWGITEGRIREREERDGKIREKSVWGGVGGGGTTAEIWGQERIETSVTWSDYFTCFWP